MCIVRTCDLGGLPACFDPQRFILLLNDNLSADERVVVARQVFEEAGMEQIATNGVYCICGLAVGIPAPPRLPELRGRLERYRLAAALVFMLAFWLVPELTFGL